eukprot:TRINITY_DN162_c0_g1_i1.p1 TRINITY_DN162_c0_g1~~TRINITY_DN162_c0_g1_i1.p1  ORF type:complete len:93 (+),score=12.62 TRINITY_DN162_c0_g1_i1:54-332(+)
MSFYFFPFKWLFSLTVLKISKVLNPFCWISGGGTKFSKTRSSDFKYQLYSITAILTVKNNRKKKKFFHNHSQKQLSVFCSIFAKRLIIFEIK